MIKSFSDFQTQLVFDGLVSRRLPFDIQRIALKKLELLNGAKDLRDLLVFPANRLEKLSGDRIGQYSIRINDKWRICFLWEESNAYEVEIINYH